MIKTTKVIDVSSYQGLIEWSKVKSIGINDCILKIIRKDLELDKQFDNNYKNCIKNSVNVIGVYNYSYATTVAKAKSDANKVVEYLKQYGVDKNTYIWLDVEDACQKGLGQLLVGIINSYAEVIKSNGYKFGVYTGQSFYNSFIKPYVDSIDCPFWIAKYSNIAPSISIKHDLYGWQYTSDGKVDGIDGKVDMNNVYTYTEEAKKDVMEIDIMDLINNARADVGYLEKNDSLHLDEKTVGAGNKNYTKYARDYELYTNTKLQGQPYCAMAVSTWLVKAYGLEKAKELLGGSLFAYTPTGANQFKKVGRYYTSNPQRGDIIFFKNSIRICHVGLVTNVTNTTIYTIEANTSGGNTLVANGGGVAEKSYPLGYKSIAGYGRIYNDTKTLDAPKSTTSQPFKNMVTASSLNIRSKPSVASSVLGSYKKGQYVEIVTVSGKWGKTEIGWISLDYVTSKNGRVVADVLNVRSGSNKDYNSVGTVKNGDILKILYQDLTSGWYLTNKGGWVSNQYVKLL